LFELVNLVNGFEKAIGLSRLQRTRLYKARAVPFGCQTRWVFKMNQLRAETEWEGWDETSNFSDFSDYAPGIFWKTYRETILRLAAIVFKMNELWSPDGVGIRPSVLCQIFLTGFRFF